MTSLPVQDTLAQLQELGGPKSELSILKISEPLVSSSSQSPSKRSSDVSTDAFDNPTPSSLEADLTHYKVHTFQYNCYIHFNLLICVRMVRRNSSPNSASRTSNK